MGTYCSLLLGKGNSKGRGRPLRKPTTLQIHCKWQLRKEVFAKEKQSGSSWECALRIESFASTLHADNCNLFPLRAPSQPLRSIHRNTCYPFREGNRKRDARILLRRSRP